MVKSAKSKPAAAKTDEYKSSSTMIGTAFEMADNGLEAAMVDQVPIDFQARQDSISEVRRSPGPKLAPKLKQTGAKPANAKETQIKL